MFIKRYLHNLNENWGEGKRENHIYSSPPLPSRDQNINLSSNIKNIRIVSSCVADIDVTFTSCSGV